MTGLLPDNFPSEVDVVATDFDRTLTWDHGLLLPRTIAALQATRASGRDVIVVTGRMMQSVLRALEPAQLDEPVICYQGAVVAAADGTWLRHEPIPLAQAREVIGLVEAEGFGLNVYVGDELYVSKLTQGARDYAGFQQLEIHPVGDLLAWLTVPPTKLVCVGDPDALEGLEVRMKEHFGKRLYISKSLPYFLEFAAAGVTKGAGLDFLAEHMGFTPKRTIAFGDGENDVELVEWAGFGIAVENAHPRVRAVADWICPSAAQEGVAQVLEAILALDSNP